MFSTKIRWYLLFDDERDFIALFELRDILVHKSMFGQVLFVKKEEEYFAFENRCPHQNKPLNNCWLEADQLVCPFHQNHYSLHDGKGHGMNVKKYFLKFENDQVYIGREVWSIF